MVGIAAARRPVALAADAYEKMLAAGATRLLAGFFALPFGRLLGGWLFA
jgi:hypothetical protein